MYKYGGYLLATIISVWGVVGFIAVSTWLKERNFNTSRKNK